MRSLVLAVLAAMSMVSAGGVAQAAVVAPLKPDDFRPCEDAASDLALTGSLCARFSAPANPGQPTVGQVDLFVRKVPASGRRLGQVWLVAGGPGESGASFYPLLDRLRRAFPGYDLMIPDHRGTGFSSRICPAEEAAGSPGGFALEGAEWATCFAALEAKTPWVQSFTISNAARDLSALMDRYAGRGPVLLYGVSYGTQLVLRTMTVAPRRRLDGIVLDSLIPPETTDRWDLSHRSAVVDAVGRQVLADCDADPACRTRVGGSALAAAQAVIDDPKASAAFPGGRPKMFLGNMLNSPAARARIPDVVAGARNGDLAPMRQAQADLAALGASFGRFPQSPASIPLVSVISASENNARPGLTKAQVEAEAAGYLFTSPLPGQMVGGSSSAYPRDAAFGKLPSALPPVLVLHGDLDPKTPYAGAQAQIALLSPVGKVGLVTVTGGPHFLLLTAPDCFEVHTRAFVRTRRPVQAICSP